MFMYPIFITDDADAQIVIKSLPGQCRWGVNRLEGFLGPLVKKGLKSVILFGVPEKCEKVMSSIILSKNFLLSPSANDAMYVCMYTLIFRIGCTWNTSG